MKKSSKSTKLQGKKECTSKHDFFFFCAKNSCHPKQSKNAIKNEKCQYFFLQVIVWYALHTKFSKKLMTQQMQMSAEIYDIWLTLQHVGNMSTKFPTKVSLVQSITTNKCGHYVPTFLHPFPVSQRRRYFVGHLHWILLSNAQKYLWQKIASLFTLTAINPFTVKLMPPAIILELALSKMTILWPSGFANSMIPNCNTLLVTKNFFPLSGC